MDTFEAISSRRAIKKFDPNHKMTSEEVDSLMKLTILSPLVIINKTGDLLPLLTSQLKKKLESLLEIRHNPLMAP